MKVEITALVTRNKKTKEILEITSITDMYSEVGVSYPHELITLEDIKKAFATWGEATKKDAYFKFIEGKDIYLQQEAKDLPSIGNVQVGIETRTIEWE